MACFQCCSGVSEGDTEFTVLFVHVIGVSHPLALEGSSNYAQSLVETFFRKHTNINTNLIQEYRMKFVALKAGSRLDIAFAGRPFKTFKTPALKTYRYEHSQGLEVIFEVDIRLVIRYVPPEFDYPILEIERTDYLPQYCQSGEFSDELIAGSRVSMRT